MSSGILPQRVSLCLGRSPLPWFYVFWFCSVFTMTVDNTMTTGFLSAVLYEEGLTLIVWFYLMCCNSFNCIWRGYISSEYENLILMSHRNSSWNSRLEMKTTGNWLTTISFHYKTVARSGHSFLSNITTMKPSFWSDRDKFCVGYNGGWRCWS